MEVAVAAGGEVAKFGIAHFERELGYLVHFRRNFHSLGSKIQQLAAERDVVTRSKDVAVNNNEIIQEPVEAWLVRADVALNEAADLIAEAGPINSWFKGWVYCSRFTLGRKAEKKILALNEILADRIAFGDIISYPNPVQSLALVTAGDFRAFQSREATTERVIKALTNDAVSLVGVHGMPGVGKTVLIEALSKQVKDKKLFDEVVPVTITQNPDLRKIQDNIAMELNLKLEDNEIDALRARRLSERLMKDTKILIVLDDLWKRLELTKVGVPLGKNNNNGCKVIFTTRDHGVCGEMETDKNIEVPLLSEADSWSLFREKAGDVIESPDIRTIAKDITKECGCLPLAIVTLGRALRGQKLVGVWTDALVQLRKSIYEEHMSPVTSSIMLSFNFLKSETSKICFLFCCFFPEDYIINIKLLIMYVIGEKLLENVNSLVEARGRLHGILEKLASSSLLLHGQRDGEYKMHDVIRDVALSIASTEGFGFMVKAGMNLTEWPFMELDKCTKRLSLMGTKIRCNLPHYQIEYPLLLSLSLNRFKDLEEIPHDFFTLMRNLLVLDLSDTRIKALPPSLECLVNLRTLLLKGCECLNNVSPVESLEKLEILDLSGSQIEALHEEMRRLTNLKLLDLSMIGTLKTIAPKVISSMRKLEELYVPFCFKGWEIKGKSGDGVNASFQEVESSTHLTYLQVRVAGFEYFSNDIRDFWKNLAGYNIVVTQDQKPDSRIPELVNAFDGPTGRRAMHLQSSDVVSVPTNGLIDNLKHLDIVECRKMDYLVNNVMAGNSLSNLEELRFSVMDKLVGMCNGTLPREFLGNLRTIRMEYCYEIRTLFPCDLLSRLQNLQRIYVLCCNSMDQVIQVAPLYTTTTHPSSSSSSSAATAVLNQPSCPMLHNLKVLWIQDCHKLRYILPMSVVGGLVQLETIKVYDCYNVEMIIANENDHEDDGDRDRDNNGILPRLRELFLINLPKLSSFCPAGIVLNSPLETLEVSECESVMNFPIWITHQSLARMNRVIVDGISLDWTEDPIVEDISLDRIEDPTI